MVILLRLIGYIVFISIGLILMGYVLSNIPHASLLYMLFN